jgi:hypothetical protein
MKKLFLILFLLSLLTGCQNGIPAKKYIPIKPIPTSELSGKPSEYTQTNINILNSTGEIVKIPVYIKNESFKKENAAKVSKPTKSLEIPTIKEIRDENFYVVFPTKSDIKKVEEKNHGQVVIKDATQPQKYDGLKIYYTVVGSLFFVWVFCRRYIKISIWDKIKAFLKK